MTKDDKDILNPATLDSIAEFGANAVNGIGKSPIEAQREVTAKKIAQIIGDAPVRKPIFYESMTKAQSLNSGNTIRVWRTSEQLPEYAEIEVHLLISKIPETANMEQVLDVLSTVPGVTAIELTDENGNGAVAYYEW